MRYNASVQKKINYKNHRVVVVSQKESYFQQKKVNKTKEKLEKKSHPQVVAL